MHLLYTDESGISDKLNDNLFIDGPYVLLGAICVDDRKYFHLERMFIDLISFYFKIEDWVTQEIHASEIWNKKEYFVNFERKKMLFL